MWVNLVNDDEDYQRVNGGGAMARQDEYSQYYGDWVLDDGYYEEAHFNAAADAEENQRIDIQIPEEIIIEEIPVQDIDNFFSL